MNPLTSARPMTLQVITLIAALLLPGLASAGWGDENWGEMVWGGTPLANIPALPVVGIAALAGVLVVLGYWLLATRRRYAKNRSLHS